VRGQVLIVDDDVDAAESMAELLGMDGHSTEVAPSAGEALEAARRILPDLVLMDIGLPGMSGYEVAALIRREPLLNPTLLVAVTGWGRETDKHAALDAGFDLHLLKPVKLKLLRELLVHIRQRGRDS